MAALLVGLLAPGFAQAFPGALVSLTAVSQKSPLDEEEEEAPPAKPAPSQAGGQKSPLDEEEEEAPPAKPMPSPAGGKKSPLDEEEEVPPGDAAKPSTSPSPSPNAGGNEESEEAEEPVCDVVFINQKAVKIKLQPQPFEIPIPVPDRLREREFKFELLTSTDKGKLLYPAKGKDLTHPIRYYEERMWDKAAAAMGVRRDKLAEPGAVFDLTRPGVPERVDQAEKLLTTALREHDSAVQQNLRQGTVWDGMFRQPLLRALLNLKLSRVDLLIAQQRYQQAEADCDRLRDEFRAVEHADGLLKERFVRLFLGPARQAAAAGDYAAARDRLDQLARRYPLDPGDEARQFRNELIAKAENLVKESERLKTTDPRLALQRLEEAAVIWPELSGLPSLRRALGHQYPMLEVAYAELPVNLSPLQARTPVERHAASLLFESLVRWVDDPHEGPHYECQLALGRPVPLARGRLFYLPPARWSDWTPDQPHLCTVEDVRFSSGLLRPWLLKEDVAAGNDPFAAALRLDRDYWYPLSLMDFPILPRHRFPGGGTDEEFRQFNLNPVGTGPYAVSQRGADYLRFAANPHYRTPGLPQIREITFHRLEPTGAVDAFLKGQVQMVYGVRPEHVVQLEQQGKTVQRLRTPSVWFLAPNYGRQPRIKSPLNNDDLRLAIAHAIDREAILNQYFRPGRSASDHAALSGPYPRDTWAYNPEVRSFDPERAKTHASAAREKLGVESLPELSLVYPAGDPETESACKQIQAQLAGVGIRIKLEDVPPETFHHRVVVERDFDLAYWRHDYEDPTYWLGGLLDPQAQRGGQKPRIGDLNSNFMGYHPDPELDGLFQHLELHKQFPQIREAAHAIHDHIYRKVPIIPLWQLDTYVAVDESLGGVRLDPISPYSGVEQWTLKPRK